MPSKDDGVGYQVKILHQLSLPKTRALPLALLSPALPRSAISEPLRSSEIAYAIKFYFLFDRGAPARGYHLWGSGDAMRRGGGLETDTGLPT